MKPVANQQLDTGGKRELSIPLCTLFMMLLSLKIFICVHLCSSVASFFSPRLSRMAKINFPQKPEHFPIESTTYD
jgi:hypothetical protein